MRMRWKIKYFTHFLHLSFEYRLPNATMMAGDDYHDDDVESARASQWRTVDWGTTDGRLRLDVDNDNHDCDNKALKGGICITHVANVKCCSNKGCTKGAVKGGVCVKNGAKKTKLCRHDGCSKQARKGGVCVMHGAKEKLCSREGCNTNAVNGGVCIAHGAKVKCCSHKGCTNNARNGGVCHRHGAKLKR